MTSELEFKTIRDLALDSFNRSLKKLEDALVVKNVRRIERTLKDVTDNKNAAIERHTQYLVKSKKSVSDPVEKAWLDDIQDRFGEVHDKTEDFFDEYNSVHESEAEKEKSRALEEDLKSALKIKVEDIQQLIDELRTNVLESRDIEIRQEITFIENKLLTALTELESGLANVISAEGKSAILRERYESERVLRKEIREVKIAAKERGFDVSVSEASAGSRSSSPSRGSSVVKVKKLDFPRFSGDIRKYNTFVRDFEDIILKTGQYSETNMSHILRTECLQGEAKNLVHNILDYNSIWDRLNDVYKDPQRVVQIITKQIEDFKKIPEKDYDLFIKFVDVIEKGYIDLNALEKSTVLDHPTTIRTIEQRCPDWILIALTTEKIRSDSAESFDFILDFLKNKRKEARKLINVHALDTPKKNPPIQTKKSAAVVTKESGGWECLVPDCKNKKQHFLATCGAFKKLDNQGVGKIVHLNKLCILCFSNKHNVSSCPRKETWKKCDQQTDNKTCDKWHSRRLHGANVPGLVLTTMSQPETDTVYLLAQHVPLQDDVVCRVLWDHGSTAALVTFDFARRANLPGVGCQFNLTVASGKTQMYNTKMFMIQLVDKQGNIHKIFAYGMDKIAGNLNQPLCKLSKTSFPGYDDVLLDENPEDVDVLVGINYAGILPVRVSAVNNLALYQSQFGTGWLVGGRPEAAEEDNFTEVSCAVRKSANFIKTADFITTEGLGVDNPRRCPACTSCKECCFKATHLSWQENKELKIIEEGLELDTAAKKWICSYPYKIDPSVLTDNYNQACAVLSSLEKRLKKRNKLSEFDAQFQEAVQRGIFQEISAADDYTGPVNYIALVEAYKSGPHTTTPLRLCMNSSMKFQGICLNDLFYKGPSALNDLYGLALRFRKHKIGFARDISKFYQSVQASVTDQHVRRVLWRGGDESKPPTIYKTMTVNFGDRPAGCVAQTALRKTAMLYKPLHPKAAEIIVDDTYSDDTASGGNSMDEVTDILDGMDKIANMGGFEYKDVIISGDPAFEEEPRKILGVGWRTGSDTLFVDTKVNFSEKKRGVRQQPDLEHELLDEQIPSVVTKRMVWRVIMSQYDLLGLVSIFTIQLKLLMRNLSKENCQKIGWDEQIPEDLKITFIDLVKKLQQVKLLQFPRSISSSSELQQDLPELIIMVDGSQQASCSLAYVRWILKDGSGECHFLTGKTRVAPLRKISVPRMELQAAVLGVRLCAKIEQYSGLQFSKKYFLTDASSVLGMIRGDCSTFLEFVGTRVSEIRSKSAAEDWYWIPTGENLADLGTRPFTNPHELDRNSEYQIGKAWMTKPVDEWPISYKIGQVPEDEKLKAHRCLSVKKESLPLFDISRFSSYKKVLRITATVILACQRFKMKRQDRKEPFFIDHEALDKAEHLLVMSAQNNMMSTFSSKYLSLQPSLQKSEYFPNLPGIIVASGRVLPKLIVGYDKPYLPLLECTSPLAKLIMMDAHDQGHPGQDRTVQLSRHRVWVVKARKLAKTVIDNCFKCKLLNKKLAEQIMAPLPAERLPPSPPFKNVAIDFFGPITIKDTVKQRVSKETWGVVFCCMVTSAIHLEVSESYSTDSFLLCLRRFLCLRGTPSYIQSDPGSQLVAAKKIVQEWDYSLIEEYMEQNSIRWNVVPANSQHYNGCAESIIKTVKKHLVQLLFPSKLTKGELDTIFAEVALMVNSRPLMFAAGADPLSEGPITPLHLLMGRATLRTPLSKTDEKPSLQKRLRFIEELKEQFWSKWTAQVLPKLVPSQKWHFSRRNVEIGDIVLIKDGQKFNFEYKRARVVDRKLGVDSKVRQVTLEYKNNSPGVNLKSTPFMKTERSIHNIAVLVPVDWKQEDIEKAVNEDLIQSPQSARLNGGTVKI